LEYQLSHSVRKIEENASRPSSPTAASNAPGSASCQLIRTWSRNDCDQDRKPTTPTSHSGISAHSIQPLPYFSSTDSIT